LAILQGRRDEAGALLDRAWAGADDASVRALVSQRRVLHALGMCNGPELVQWADRALELAGPDEPVGVEAAAIRGLGLGGSGRSDEARAAYEALATRVTTGAQAQRIRMGRGWLDLALDDPLTARQDLEGAVPTRYWMGSIRISLWAQAWLARTLFTVGEWEAALGVVARAAAQVSESGHGLIRPLIHWTGVQINALRGDDAAAREHLRRGAATPQDYPIMQIPAALASAQLAEATADYEGALRSLHPVSRLTEGDVSHEPGLWPWVDVYGNALVMTGRVDEAEQFLDPHRGLAQARGHRSGAARIGLVEGRIRGARGDVEGATEAFEEALEQLDELPMPYDRARVGFAYGQTLRRAARRRDADAVMQVARDAFATLGATSYVVRCDRELKAGGLNASRSTNVGDLTPQELAVADLVASGRSNKQAAEELFLSVKTIQYHLTRIYAKLGIRSRTELAARHTPSGQDEDN
ncbi:MAG: LuxR C-terminal-related transcriptional regulator, partial [Nocardioidaceae bacterium]